MNWELDPAFWHERFSQQAGWTQQVRQYLFGTAGIQSASRILEVGCGTGAVLQELPGVKEQLLAKPDCFGLDIDPSFLGLAKKNAPPSVLTCGDAHLLPYAVDSFDIAYCHYTLLWTARPAEVVAEMRRVVRPGGWVLLLAEPDYGGRIDYPHELTMTGIWQRQALRMFGADPDIGRSLGALLCTAGFHQVQSGVLGGQWQHPSADDGDLEWEVLRRDLAVLPAAPDQAEVDRLRAIDLQSRQTGERLMYVPTFYASGIK